MSGIELASGVVLPFLDRLASSDRFHLISSARNSFEGWLKWELVDLICRSSLKLERFDPVLLGVEGRVDLLERVAKQDKAQKLVDIWLRASEIEPIRYHYLELKVVFANENWAKQAASAGWDLWYLASMTATASPATIGSLALFVGDDGAQVTSENVREKIQEAYAPLNPAIHERDLGGQCWAFYFETDWASAHRQLKDGGS